MKNQRQRLRDTALQLTQSGISVIPIGRNKLPYASLLPIETDENGSPALDAKGNPKHTWNPYRERLAIEDELVKWFGPAFSLATVGGFDGLEILDFDNHKNAGVKGKIIGNVYPSYVFLIKSQRPDLFAKLFINSTPSDGNHIKYRYQADVYEGNQKLAEAYEIDPDTDEIVLDERGKPKKVTLIETRGEGGYAVSPPSPGYQMVQSLPRSIGGDLTNIPTITKEERDFLITVARSFHAIPNDPHQSQNCQSETASGDDRLRPGDDFNQRGDHVPILEEAGWVITYVRDGVEYWRRPGKDFGWSATWGYLPDRFYVFSSNASPFESNRTYDRFSIYTFLKHDGNFESAARDLAEQGYGEQRGSNRSGWKNQSTSDESSEAADEDQVFDELLAEIEEASTITDRLKRSKRVKAIIERLVDLAPFDQSMFIDQMKEAGLGSKGTLEAQLKDATKAKKDNFSSFFAPSDDDEARFAHGIYEGKRTYDRLEFNKALGSFIKRPITSFLAVPTELVKVNGYDVFRVDFVTEARPIATGVLHRRDFNDRKRFKDALKSSVLQFLGTDNDLQGILGILSQYDVPIREGTPKIGLYNGDDEPIWLTDDGAFTADGFIDNPQIVYMPDGGMGVLDGKFVYPELSDNDYQDFLCTVSENLFNLNLTDAIIPIVGWFAAAAFKPKLVAHFGGFPLLNVYGTFGSGKTTLLRTFARLFGLFGGIGAELFDCQQSKFILSKLLSSTTTHPIVLDEHKPDIPKTQRNLLVRMLRRSWNGDLEMRGRADQSWIEYRITAPVCVCGETPLIESALLQRILAVNLSPNNMNGQMRDAYHRVKNLPLQAFGSRYIPFVLRTDFEAEIKHAEAVTESILEGLPMPDRVEICIKTMVFGFLQFQRFQQEILGHHTVDVSDEAFISAVLNARTLVCGTSGKTKTALDYMVETWATMAEKEFLKRGRDYDVSDDEDEIYIRYQPCADEFREYVRRRDLSIEVLNDPAYRQMIRESPYFTSTD